MDTAPELVKMDPEVKAEWLAALRSGNYRQGRGYLRRNLGDGNEGFCCLGIVCDLYAKANPEEGKWEISSGRHGSMFYAGADNAATDLPNEVQDWAKLRSDSVRSYLARQNDGGYSFLDIANWIEENL